MYVDTPRELRRQRLRELALRRPAARLGHDRDGGDRPRGDPRHVPRLPRPLVHGRSAWSSASAGRSGTTLLERLEELVGDIDRARPARPSPRRPPADGSRGPDPHEAVGPGARRDRRAQLPARSPGPLRPAAALDRPRRRHVVAPVHRGARAARARVLRLLREPELHGRRHARRTGRRRPAAESTTRSTTIVGELRKIAGEPVPAEELEKARSFAKGRFVLGLESPHGTIMFGLRREMLEGGRWSRRRCSRGSTPSPSRTSSASRRRSLGGELRLALIGPFDDPERFERAHRRLSSA